MTFRHKLDSVLLFRGRVMQAKTGLLGVRDGQVMCLVMLGSSGDPLCASLCPLFVRHVTVETGVERKPDGMWSHHKEASCSAGVKLNFRSALLH